MVSSLATLSLKPSQSGTYLFIIRSTWPTRLPQQTLTMSIWLTLSISKPTEKPLSITTAISKSSQCSNVCWNAFSVNLHTLHQQTWVSTWLASLLQIMRLLSKPLNKKSSAVTIKQFLTSRLKRSGNLLSRRLNFSWTTSVSHLQTVKLLSQHVKRLKKPADLP